MLRNAFALQGARPAAIGAPSLRDVAQATRRSGWLLAVAGSVLISPTQGVSAPACEGGKGYVAVDVSLQVDERFVRGIKQIGIGTIIRYYDWKNETLPGKTLTKSELALIGREGLRVGVVFQHNNNCLCTFMNPNRADTDSGRVIELSKFFSQPRGSAIYFGVDGVDAQYLDLLRKTGLSHGEAQATRFVDEYVGKYFERIASNMKSSGYNIGVYGSGLVCKYLLQRGLAKYCWLANATSWPGYSEMDESKAWALKQHLPTKAEDCFGREADLNSGNPSVGDFGQWKP